MPRSFGHEANSKIVRARIRFSAFEATTMARRESDSALSLACDSAEIAELRIAPVIETDNLLIQDGTAQVELVQTVRVFESYGGLALCVA